ncbi:peptide ABC transporter substrate-binding protein [Nocardioides sp. P5_C9_2]
MKRTPKWLTLVPAVLLLAVAGCSGGDGDGDGSSTSAPGDQSAGGSFSLNSSEPQAFAPTSNCYSSDCSQIINLVWTGLLKVDPETSEQQLQMAESIESKDGQHWTIKLKDGFTFQNGEPVDAASFLRAWNYAAYGPNATQLGFFLARVEGYDDLQGDNPKATELSGITAPDDLTIKITLTEPFSQLPLVLSFTPIGVPMAQACLDDIKACNEKPIGNGPYEFAEPWQHNDSITLKTYADYTDDATAGLADEIVFKIYADLKTAYRDFQAGNLDIVTPDPSQTSQARTAYPDQILEVDNGAYVYMGFPLYEKNFQDVRIRRALSLAVDRQAIIDRVLDGRFTPATDVISPFVPGSRDDACTTCVYDPEEAKKLWDEAGGIPGNTMNIWFNNDGGHEDWVQAMAQGWQSVLGLDYEFKSQPFTPYQAALDTRSTVDGPYRLSWIPDYASPQNYLDPLYGLGSTNYGDWKGPEHDKFLQLLAEGDAAATVDEGLPSYQAAADVVLDYQVNIPLWFGKTFIVFSTNVENVKYSPTDQLLLSGVSVTR